MKTKLVRSRGDRRLWIPDLDEFAGAASRLAGVLFAVVWFCVPVSAQLTTVAQYRFGEADGGVAGSAVTNAADSSGNGFHLDVIEGSQLWSSDTPSAAGKTLPLGASALSVQLTPPSCSYRNAGGETNSQVTVATDNVGIEAWVKSAESSRSAILAHNGRTALPPLNGFGLAQLGPGVIGNTNTVYAGQVAGMVFVGSAPVSTNEWTHLALVRDSAAFGGWRFYVNGVLNGANAAPGVAAAGTLELGAAVTVPGGALPFSGLVDELRVFTFPSGQFNPSDLNVTP